MQKGDPELAKQKIFSISYVTYPWWGSWWGPLIILPQILIFWYYLTQKKRGYSPRAISGYKNLTKKNKHTKFIEEESL